MYEEAHARKCIGMAVKYTDFPAINCDACALAESKQQNHLKVTLIEVMQPLLELVYTDVSGPIRPSSGARNRHVAKLTDHHTRLKSVYFLCKKNEDIDALINYTQVPVIPSGHRLQCFRSDCGGEYTGLEYREYCLQTGIKQEFSPTNTPQQDGISERECGVSVEHDQIFSDQGKRVRSMAVVSTHRLL